MSKQSNLKVLLNGIIKESPVLVLTLGTCPTLAVTSLAVNGLGMGLAATAVLLGSNIVISLLRKVIPDKVRIPSYIVIIAGFVTVVSFLLEAYVPDIYEALGLFLPLIVVNCIILGRAEMFANKNGVVASACDAIGMGLGFTLALLCMGSIREILGSGTWFGLRIIPESVQTMSIMTLAPGGFFVFGCLIALVNSILMRKGKKPKQEIGCSGCPMAGKCAEAAEGGCK